MPNAARQPPARTLRVPSASFYAGWSLLGTLALPLSLLALLLPPCAAFARCLHNGCSPVSEERLAAGGKVVQLEMQADGAANGGPESPGREYRM